jgi:hypothetical protein
VTISHDEIESSGEEVHDLLVSTRPYVLLAVLIEDQERVDVERSVHQNVEVEPVGIGWLTDAEVVREAHARKCLSDNTSTDEDVLDIEAGCASKVGVRAAAPTQLGQLDALSTDIAATGGPRKSSGTASRAVICATLTGTAAGEEPGEYPVLPAVVAMEKHPYTCCLKRIPGRAAPPVGPRQMPVEVL